MRAHPKHTKKILVPLAWLHSLMMINLVMKPKSRDILIALKTDQMETI